MKSALRYIGGGVALYLLFLALTVPLGQVLSRAMPENQPLPLKDMQGNVFTGSAALARLGQTSLQDLQWIWRPQDLLSLQLGYGVDFLIDKSRGSINLGVGVDGTYAVNGMDLSVAALKPFLPPLTPTVGGVLDADLSGIVVDGNTLTAAEGDILWNEATIRLGQDVSLGNVLLTLETKDSGISGTLSNEGGQLKLEGELTLSAGGQYQIKGFIGRHKETPGEIRRMLKDLGNLDSKGRLPFQQRGRLSV